MAQSSTHRPAWQARAVFAAFVLPWNGFVAMFLYYALLAMVSIGGADFSGRLMALAYLLPVVGYVAMLLNRAIHALVALPIEIGETPHALQH